MQSTRSTRTRLALAAAAALAALLAALPAAAQRSDAEWLENCREQRDQRARHCEVRTETLRPSGSITVDGGENGGATVRGWDGDQVRVSARIQAQAATEAEARELARQVTVRTDGGTIRAEGPARSRGASWSVMYDVQVPRRHDVAVTTRNGPVGVEDVTGRMTLRAENGPVSLRRVGGAVNARVRNGPLSVVLEGARWNGEGLDAEAVNGPVTLTLPRDYSARLEVGTINGPVKMDLPLAGGYRSGRHVQATLGSGGAPVRVVTTNGPFTVRRGSR
ncbi:MAG TPA: DUF4097 family beta strand repeat-containing protein [Longimicrobiaceae bacterium]|nr:DUF4097 family beta strand repeat-containing protein [Longimicrobiaceae bacterium]